MKEAGYRREEVVARLKARRRRDDVVSPLAPEKLARGTWAGGLDWPEPLRAGVLEPRKGYRYRPENLALALLLDQYGNQPERVLDLGAGSGSLTLIARYFLTPLKTTALELQPAQADRLTRTIQAHGLEDLEVVCGDLRDGSTVAHLSSELGDGADLIVCNPPWFPANWGRVSVQASTRRSTHAEHGDVMDFLSVAEELLNDGGRIWLLYDAQRIADLLPAVSDTSLTLSRVAWISDQRPEKDGQPYRAWCELEAGTGASVEQIL